MSDSGSEGPKRAPTLLVLVLDVGEQGHWGLAGKPLIFFVLECALAVPAKEVRVLVKRPGDETRRSVAEEFGSRVHVVAYGPGGLATELQEAVSPCGAEQGVLLLSGDAPLLAPADVAALCREPLPRRGFALIGQGPHAGPLAVLCAAQDLRVSMPPAHELESAGLRSFAGCIPVDVSDLDTLLVVEDHEDLALAEDRLNSRKVAHLRRSGVVIRGHVRVEAGVVVAPGAILEHGVVLRGATRVEAGARIDVGSVLSDTVVDANAYIKPYTVCDGASVGAEVVVGPFAHLRPASEIRARARIGNFVETKNVVVREGAMANHLAYLGDGELGERANIGAGTIFCNSDGVNKFRTYVGPRAFVGSDCQLVAPVTVGEGAFVATGTTVTRDVPANALAIARVPQQNKEGYAVKLRERFETIRASRDRKKG